MPRSIGWSWDDRPDKQTPFDVAVVMPTVVRPTILRALGSIFGQDFPGSIQVLIGVDGAAGNLRLIDEAFRVRPRHVSGYVLTLPYSTSQRHGGVHSALDGGSLRAVLAMSAHARHVAFLDDDNAWRPGHLRVLRGAIEGKAFAFSRRLFVRETDFVPLVVDEWDSMGPGRGRFAKAGGFVDPNCLMIDKVALAPHLGRWAETVSGRPGTTADRNFFSAIRREPCGRSDDVTVLYAVRPNNVLLRLAQAERATGSGQAGSALPDPAAAAR